jgi:uncharacterized protein (DUF488 family)
MEKRHALFTIGFTKTSMADFFGRLNNVRVQILINVRLNRSSQLLGFAKNMTWSSS